MSEFFEKLISYFTDMGISRWLAVAYLVVSALLIVMAVVAIVMRIIVVCKYYAGNHQKTKSGKTSFQVAEEALAKAGMSDVKVKKAGFLRAFFIGNCYSITKNTIFLRGSIADKDSITAVGLALQKVGVAKLCKSGDKKAITRNKLQFFDFFAPILFVPLVLIGVAIDILAFQNGIASMISIGVGLLFVILGFIEKLLNIPVEKKANDMAMQTIKETNLLDAEEQSIIKKVFDAYIIAYVCEFIIAVLRLVQLVLEIAMNSQISKK